MRAIMTILLGGGAAGALDIIYAIAANGARGIPSTVILQSIASGVLGRSAYAGGFATAALGLTLHFLMTTLMAAGFVIIVRMAPVALKSPALAGVVYGLLLFVLMNYLIVPLSAAYPGTPPQGWVLVGALFAHTALVGAPIAFIARHFLARR